MNTMQKAEIEITSQNLWLLESYLNVYDFADLFPPDSKSGAFERGVPFTLKTDEGFDIVTDIDRWQVRNRSHYHGWKRWTTCKMLMPGDRIVIERTGEREYVLSLIRGDQDADGTGKVANPSEARPAA